MRAGVEAEEVPEVAEEAHVEGLLVVRVEVAHARAGALERELAAHRVDAVALAREREHRVADAVEEVVLAAVLEVDPVLGEVEPGAEADALLQAGARRGAGRLDLAQARQLVPDRAAHARPVELDVVVAREEEDPVPGAEHARGRAEPALVIGEDPARLIGAALLVERELVERARAVLHPRGVEVEEIAVEDELERVAGRDAREQVIDEAGELGVRVELAPAVEHPERVRGVLGVRLAEVHVGDDGGVSLHGGCVRFPLRRARTTGGPRRRRRGRSRGPIPPQPMPRPSSTTPSSPSTVTPSARAATVMS